MLTPSRASVPREERSRGSLQSIPPSLPFKDSGPRGVATVGIFAILCFGALYAARSVLVPLAFGLMLYLLMAPLVRRLARLKIPRSLSATLLLGGTVALLTFGTVELSTPASAWAQRLPAAVSQLETKSRVLKGPVERLSQVARKVESAAQVSKAESAPVVAVAEPGFVERLLQGTPAFLAQAVVTLISAFFLLLKGDTLLRRLFQLVPDFTERTRADEIVYGVEHGMGTYLRTITVINLALGVVLAGVLHVLGVPNPVLWGGVAALVNFVPYLGPAVGIFLVAAVSLLSFDTLAAAAVPPLAYLMLTTIEGNVITPAVLGRTFRISPLVVFVWLVFWTWLWSVPGAVLAVPLLMLVNIVCEKSPRFSGLPRLFRA